MLITSGWKELDTAQRNHDLATTGPYARIRRLQYVGFVAVMFGFRLQWPTLPKLAMFPVLVVIYLRLACHEELDALGAFEEHAADTW